MLTVPSPCSSAAVESASHLIMRQHHVMSMRTTSPFHVLWTFSPVPTRPVMSVIIVPLYLVKSLVVGNFFPYAWNTGVRSLLKIWILFVSKDRHMRTVTKMTTTKASLPCDCDVHVMEKIVLVLMCCMSTPTLPLPLPLWM